MLHARILSGRYVFSFEYKNRIIYCIGRVVLPITGVEALYADMGNTGKFPIRPAYYRGIAVVSTELLWSGRIAT